MDLVIRNGTIVTASDVFKADVGISGEKITAIGHGLTGEREIDAEGKLVFPGMIDPHVHMALPFGGTVSADDFKDGTVAAACGGVTTIIDFAIQAKGKSLAETVEARRAEADPDVCIDYGLHPAITDFTPEVLAEVPEMIAAGMPTFKLFMTYEGWAVDDGTLFATLEAAGANGGMVGVHAENYKLLMYLIERLVAEGKTAPRYHAESRPDFCEAEAVARAILWAEQTNSPLYFFHLSSRAGLEYIIASRDRGFPIYAETCTQYLLLTDERYDEPDFGGAKYVMSPPLRKEADQKALWRGLATGDIQVVGSDHCPFTMEQKRLGEEVFTKIPNGAPGVETTLPLLYSEGVGKGRISLNRLVEVFSTNPAKLFGLYPEKGTIAVGTDADLVIFDPDREVTISVENLHMKADYTPYEGMKVKGYPVITISRGEVICEHGQFKGEAGRGRFIARKRITRI